MFELSIQRIGETAASFWQVPLVSAEAIDVRVAEVLQAWVIETTQVVTRGERSRKRVKQVLGVKVDIGHGEKRIIVSDVIHILDAESAVGKQLVD